MGADYTVFAASVEYLLNIPFGRVEAYIMDTSNERYSRLWPDSVAYGPQYTDFR
jgi:hypothetical protein